MAIYFSYVKLILVKSYLIHTYVCAVYTLLKSRVVEKKGNGRERELVSREIDERLGRKRGRSEGEVMRRVVDERL